ncbi:MAG: cysteine desulfurase NifS [Thermoplasmata archaeon]|nr:cysteine desulfurase NifS [Thermoplasmata archaeon]
MVKPRIYFDNSATTMVAPEVVEAMLPYYTQYYGNASSLHTFGQEAKKALEESRAKVAALINAQPDEIIFTGGGTESDNIAIKGIAYRNRTKGKHIITSSIEHPAVLETCRALEKEGFELTYVRVSSEGIVDTQELERSIRKDTILITVMHSNNEIGTIQPVEEIGEIAARHGIPFHTDAVQSAGKIKIDVKAQHIDLLTLTAHKIHGPKGVGALYIRKGIQLQPIIHGGGHEKGLRSSTENVAGVVGFGKACEIAATNLEANADHMRKLRERAIEGVLASIEASYLNGHRTQRLPNNANFRFTGIEGESLVLMLDEAGFATSTGSACSSHKLQPSHVLMALGLRHEEAHGSLRVTFSRYNTEAEVDLFLQTLPGIVGELRKISPLWNRR